VDQQALHMTLMRFGETLNSDYAPLDVLYDLCDAIGRILDVSGAGVMLFDAEGVLRFVAASDETVREIETLQIELDEGPCLTSARSGETVQVLDLARSGHPFPRFAPEALRRGLRAVFSFPMTLGEQRIGALNLYRDEPMVLEGLDEQTGLLLANMATAYLVNAQTREASARQVDQLQRALDSRIVIEQAKGTLAERHGETMEAAFSRLRARARSTQRRLHDVAEDVTKGRLQL
jgi:hypothetical protein